MILGDRYRVLETMVDSDIRSVYLTEHQLIHRRMVVKVLQSGADPAMHARFLNEAETAGRLRHPNIIESMDMGYDAGRPYVVFEHLEGVPLAEEIARLGRLPIRRAVHIVRQVVAALAAAHGDRIVHGNLDASRIFLVDRETDPDFVKVLGLGTLGRSSDVPAPEQVALDPIDHRCDVWSVGVLLYEMVTGHKPFTDSRQILMSPPSTIERNDVTVELTHLIYTCLAKPPDERFQDMAALHDALEPFEDARGSTIPPAIRHRQPSAELAVYYASSPTPAHIVALPPPPPQRSRVPLYTAIGGGIIACVVAIILVVGTGSTPVTTAAAIPPTTTAAAAPARAPAAEPQTHVAIAADVPTARVTFRRHVTTTPMAIDVKPADTQELVEISAPGYKTMRYWITTDQATTLNVKMVRGNGLVEATPGDTIAAAPKTAPVRRAPTATPARRKDTAPTPAPAPVTASAFQESTTTGPALGATATVAQLPTLTPAKPIAPTQVGAAFLEPNRIGGTRNPQIVPDNATRQAMQHQGTTKIVAKFSVCVSASGAASASVVGSSGFAEYDNRLLRELRGWRFKPIAVNGEVVPVCAPIVFAYTQQ